MKQYLTKNYSEKDKGLHVCCVSQCKPEPKHTHDFIEIVYTYKGEMDQEVNGKEFLTKKGDLLFINYNSVHSFKPIGEASYFNVLFYPETLGHFINSENAFALLSLSAFQEISKDSNEGIVSFAPKEQKKILWILETMYEEQTNRAPHYEEINEAYMNILVTMILRKTSLPLEEKETDDTWNELASYIEENLDGDLSLSALAKKCFYNPSYFCRMFKRKFGTNLVDYVNRKRIDKAQDLLRNTELSIESVANAVGYSSKSVFYRSFTKLVHMTTSESRKSRD